MNVTAVEFNKREMSRLNVFFVQGPCLGSSPGGCVPTVSQPKGAGWQWRSGAGNLVHPVPWAEPARKRWVVTDV